jgi:hypothetical protein
MEINQRRVDFYSKVFGKISPLFLNSVKIYGEENLKEIKDKTFILNSNHESFAEIFWYTILLNRNKIKQPYIVASEHLNSIPINCFLYINRKIAKNGTREEKIKIKENEISKIEKIVEKKESLLYFPEGGFRNVGENPMEETRFTYTKYFIQSLIKLGKSPEEIYSINAAVHYKDRTVEEPFFEFSRKMKSKSEEFLKKARESKNFLKGNYAKSMMRSYLILYSSADFFAYFTNLFDKKPDAFIKIGKPFPIEEYMKQGGWIELGKRSTEEIKELHREIS